MKNFFLYQGDCLNVIPTLKKNSVDLVLTDPPFGFTKNKWDKIIPYDKMWNCIYHVLKPNGVILLFSFQPFSSELVVSNKKNFCYQWIWEKTMPVGFLIAKISPLRTHEQILVFNANGKRVTNTYNPQGLKKMALLKKGDKTPTKNRNYGMCHKDRLRNKTNYPRDIIKFSKGSKLKSGHPTEKPVFLLRYLINTYSIKKQTVLDFTMGGGSCGEASLVSGRKFIGIEKEKEWFDIAKNRIENI